MALCLDICLWAKQCNSGLNSHLERDVVTAPVNVLSMAYEWTVSN